MIGGLLATRNPLILGSLVSVLILHPWLTAGVLGARLWRRSRRLAARRCLAREAQADLALLPRLLLVGLAGGMALPGAIELSAGHLRPVVRAELAGLLRNSRRHGLAGALTSSVGGLTQPLFARLAVAQASGAPMVDTLAAYLAESRAIRRGEAIERMRRLPVTLMIPLGLLILPGFVVIFVGPILLEALTELSRSLP
jgi:tight adherence protein B